MEIIKKITLSLILILSVSRTLAISYGTYQSAFYKSYEQEKSGNYTAASKELIAIYNPADYFINIRLGWLHYLSKQYAESIQYYQKAINLKPYAIEAKFGIIKPLSAIENWDRVKEQYLNILKIDSQNTLANYWLGVIYYNRKDYANAEKLFEKIVNLYPLDYDSVIMLGWTKLNLEKSSEARVLFNHALVIRPNDNSALTGLKTLK